MSASLDNDPHEEHNLAATDQKESELWRSQSIKLLANRPECFSDGTKRIAGRHGHLSNDEASK